MITLKEKKQSSNLIMYMLINESTSSLFSISQALPNETIASTFSNYAVPAGVTLAEPKPIRMSTSS